MHDWGVESLRVGPTPWLYPNLDPFEEHDERFVHVALLRQEGLEAARRSGADYLFVSYQCDHL